VSADSAHPHPPRGLPAGIPVPPGVIDSAGPLAATVGVPSGSARLGTQAGTPA
jgi:hypothetical protein